MQIILLWYFYLQCHEYLFFSYEICDFIIHAIVDKRINNPMLYECLVRKYDIGHSRLRILVREIDNNRNKFHIEFSSVIYFSGHLKWMGANFEHGTSDELRVFLALRRLLKNIMVFAPSPQPSSIILYFPSPK